jgi:hypothetical protein
MGTRLCHFALFAKSTEIEKAATLEPTIVVSSKSAISTNVGMYNWIISFVVQNPVILVIVLAVIGVVACFGWWKRKCNTKKPSDGTVELICRAPSPPGIAEREQDLKKQEKNIRSLFFLTEFTLF